MVTGTYAYMLTCSNALGATSASVEVRVGGGGISPPGTVMMSEDEPGAPVEFRKTDPGEGGLYTLHITRTTYILAGQAIATRITGDPDGNDGRYYLHSDHLGSVSAMSNANGDLVGEVTRYTPFGDYRSGGPNPITDRGFTGQKENMADLGLYYYNARYYAPGLGRFLSADTLVPDPISPQSLNRYTYVLNAPVKFRDPSGHCAEYGDDTCWSAYDRLYAYMHSHPEEYLYDGSIWLNQEAWNEVGTWSLAAIEGFYDAIAHPATTSSTDSSKGVSPGTVGIMANWTELLGSISDYNDDLHNLFGKGAFRLGRGLPGPSGTILVGTGSFLKSIDDGDSWGRAIYNAGVDIAYDAGVDFVAEATGLLAGAATIETGPGAVAFGTGTYVAVQLGSMALVDPVKDNIADQVYSAFTERTSDPLDVNVQPIVYPLGFPDP